jgi:hypothetical protein
MTAAGGIIRLVTRRLDGVNPDGIARNLAWQAGADPRVAGDGREPPEPQFVRLTWRDAWVDEDERQIKDFAEELVVTTVGYLVRATEDLISVAAERLVQDGKVTYRSTTHVWRCMLLGEPEVLLSALAADGATR